MDVRTSSVSSSQESRSRDYSNRASTNNNIERERGQDGSTSAAASIQAWLGEHAWKDIFIPILTFMLWLSFFTVISAGAYTGLYLYMMPKALVKEPLYFDYSVSPPTGKINLMSAHKQWEYMSGGVSSGSSRSEEEKDTRRFLRSDFEYTVDIAFELSKSNRNFDIGKFMAHLSLFDNLGDLVAKSSRPVVMPYQSVVSLVMDSLVKFPFRLVGLCGVNEVTTVHIPMMTEYREPHTTFTDSIELTLSSDKPDIGAVEVTVMPVLKGLVYFMWYYPVACAFVGISSTLGFQLSLYFLYVLVSFVISYVTGEEEEEGGDGALASVARSASDVDRGGEDTRDGDKSASSVESNNVGEGQDVKGLEVEVDEDEEEVTGTGTPFTDYSDLGAGHSDAHSSSSSSSSSGAYHIVDDASALSAENEIEAVLIGESSGDPPPLLRRRKGGAGGGEEEESEDIVR